MTQKQIAIKQLLKAAESVMNEIENHLESGYYNTALNRMYYSYFHATQALLLTIDLAPKTHSGTSHLLHQHFVQKGLFDSGKAAILAQLMSQRNNSDYSGVIIIDENEVLNFLDPANEYLYYTISLVNKYLDNENTAQHEE